MSKLYGLIPAAGKGTRARPYTTMIPKCMLDINGAPLILRNIAIMRDDLGITDIVIVVGYLGEHIRKFLGDGSQYNVSITYVKNDNLEKGLAYSILLAKPYIDDHCVVILSDEYYINSNHKDLVQTGFREAMVTCATMRADDQELIKKNYAVDVHGQKVVQLIEKPKSVKNDLMGLGTFVLSPDFFVYLEKAFDGVDYIEFVSLINAMCDEGGDVRAFELHGEYININDRDSLNLANIHERSAMYDKSTISLLIYSEGDEQDVAFAVNRYRTLDFIDHFYLILPHNNSIEPIVGQLDVEVIKCPREINQYGEMQKYALEQVAGDILILCDADYSFPNRDIRKLLAYLREADMVIGTRTTRQLIEQGSKMKGIVRLANIQLAKLLEVLWWNFEARFTDTQCVFRVIWRQSFDLIKADLNCKGGEFGTEMIIALLEKRRRIIEIPVNYQNRPGSASRKYHTFRTYFSILFLILRKRGQRLLAGRS